LSGIAYKVGLSVVNAIEIEQPASGSNPALGRGGASIDVKNRPIVVLHLFYITGVL
jgi:hypothetical protein